jgi:hypothetical protein
MMLDGDRFAPWSTIHNGAAIVFTGALGLHLLAHLWDAPIEAAGDVRSSHVQRASLDVPGGRWRIAATVAAFVLGLVLAAVAMPSAQWATSRPPGAHQRGD